MRSLVVVKKTWRVKCEVSRVKMMTISKQIGEGRRDTAHVSTWARRRGKQSNTQVGIQDKRA